MFKHNHEFTMFNEGKHVCLTLMRVYQAKLPGLEQLCVWEISHSHFVLVCTLNQLKKAFFLSICFKNKSLFRAHLSIII